MKQIMDTLKKNEEIARKFLAVEAALDAAGSPAELLETLLERLGAEFDIPYLWLTFVNREGTETLLSRLALPETFRELAGMLDEESFAELLPSPPTPVLANENLSLFYRLFPRRRKYFLKSIAVVPLFLQGKLIGSVNLGDAFPERYSAGMDASLLQQLAGKVSERLAGMLDLSASFPP